VSHTYFYNYAHRPRLEKLLYIELSISANGHFKPPLDPDGRFASETTNHRTAVSVKWSLHSRFRIETVIDL
jgi:hypothetical protein